jgi:enoyl-[acyl-carrier-protein] reductase (NADH)
VIRLLSDKKLLITGEIVHVDGGLHAMGAPLSREPVARAHATATA